MKLIFKGKPKPGTFRGTCKTCGSTFDAEPEELKIEYDEREHGQFAHASCPICCRQKQPGDLVMYPKFVG